MGNTLIVSLHSYKTRENRVGSIYTLLLVYLVHTLVSALKLPFMYKQSNIWTIYIQVTAEIFSNSWFLWLVHMQELSWMKLWPGQKWSILMDWIWFPQHLLPSWNTRCDKCINCFSQCIQKSPYPAIQWCHEYFSNRQTEESAKRLEPRIIRV